MFGNMNQEQIINYIAYEKAIDDKYWKELNDAVMSSDTFFDWLYHKIRSDVYEEVLNLLKGGKPR